MSGYTKLFGSIIASTIWRESKETKIVWITMLAMANRDGVVEASIPGLADMARVSLDDALQAIETLSAPDKYSRTKDHEGRRICEVPGGWLLLNHAAYRAKMNADDRREYLAQKKRESRERAGQQMSTPVNKCRGSQHNAEAEAEAEALPSTKYGRFAEPSQAEVELECAKIGLPPAEGTKFLAFYGSKGWKVGKSPMKNWRMALVGWRTRWEENRPRSAKSPLAGMSAEEMDLETVKWKARLDAETEAF